MADYPRPGSSDRTLRSHGEQIRRIRTRIPTGDEASVYQITDADCVNDGGAGWFIESLPYPAFVRQGALVMLTGDFHLYLPYSGSVQTIIPPGVIPSEFRPHTFERIFSGGLGFTDDNLWMVYLWADGRLTLADMHVGTPFNHPDPAWGDATTGTQHALHLSTTFPAADLGLGDYPP